MTDLSVTQAAASGSGSLTYDDTSGVFTFTPPASSGGDGGGGGAGNLATVLGTGNTTAGNNIVFGDSSGATDDRLVFGSSSDLSIYHDGSHSRIEEQGTGVLFLQTNGTNIQLNKGTSENMLVANVDGSVDLYYDNAKKFETTSTGVDVAGTIFADTNLGIRHNNPAENLHVHQDDSDASRAVFTNSTTGTSGGFLVGLNSSEQAVVQLKENKDMIFYTNNTERLRITAEGHFILSNLPQSSGITGTDLTLPAGAIYRTSTGYLKTK